MREPESNPEPESHTETVTACIALGANLGDRRGAIRSAIDAIGALPGVLSSRASSVIETEPVGPPGQPMYLNAVVRVETTLGPRELLEALLAIEAGHGRERRERWGARTLDLDIVLFGDAVIDEPGLTVPHPRFRDRLFVLGPLAEVGGELVDPVTGKTIHALLCVIKSSS